MDVDKLTDWLLESMNTIAEEVKRESEKPYDVSDKVKIQQLIGKHRGLKLAFNKVIDLKIEANQE